MPVRKENSSVQTLRILAPIVSRKQINSDRDEKEKRAKRKQTYVHTQQTMSRFILATSRI